MHQDVELAPPAIDLGKELVDLLLLRDVARAHRYGLVVRQGRDQLEHVVLQAVVRPVERQLCALPWNAVGVPHRMLRLFPPPMTRAFLPPRRTLGLDPPRFPTSALG